MDVQDGRQQAHYVAEEIARWVGAGVQPREIAVLYRSHFHALEAQLELQRRGIPFAITSGVRFFEQAHIKDVCAVLRLAHAPADALAFRRLLPLLPRIGERGAARIWRDLGERFNPLSRAENQALLLRLPEPARAAWTRTAAALATVPAEPPGDRAGRLIEKFIESFYDEYIALNFEDADRRREDLQALMDYTARYDTLGDFLNEVALLTNVDTGGAARRRRTDGEDRVLLSTVHQAKGLEWRVVFVLWLAEGLFPSGRSLEEDPAAEEERRLFYVAVTRAKDALYLCAPKMRLGRDHQMKFYSPSRFIKEIPANLLQRERIGWVY